MNFKYTLIVAAIALSFVGGPAHALPPVGKSVPAATVSAMDGSRLDAKKLGGQVTVIFYENKDTTEQNKALKAALKRQAKTTGYADNVQIVAVADVSAWDFWPAKGFVTDAIRKEEKRAGHPIYLDWSGSFGQAFGMKSDKSNVVLVGPDGKVEVSHAGPVPADKALAILKATSK